MTLSLSPHLHGLWLDGVYVLPPGDAPPVVCSAPAPTRAQIERVAERIGARMLRWLRRKKRIDTRAVEERSNESPDDDAHTALLRACTAQGTFAKLLEARGEDDRARAELAVARGIVLFEKSWLYFKL